ncbi:MAG: NUDIX domain-containing protein [Clostridia bacterium]|nr:NUDIX domain-containing protein [Clostridia bacterium]
MIKNSVEEFINTTDVKNELSVMAVVICNNRILSTNEIIYGKETISLPKGHKEDNESIIETAIRECFEETNIVISEKHLIKELTPYCYEFLTPSNKLIRKTIIPFLFEVDNEGNPIPKEARMISVQWMKIEDFLENCSYESVKKIVQNALL